VGGQLKLWSVTVPEKEMMLFLCRSNNSSGLGCSGFEAMMIQCNGSGEGEATQDMRM
jgi:hypothetical protein